MLDLGDILPFLGGIGVAACTAWIFVRRRAQRSRAPSGDKDVLDAICGTAVAFASQMKAEHLQCEPPGTWLRAFETLKSRLVTPDSQAKNGSSGKYDLDAQTRNRILDYYLPVFAWVLQQKRKHMARGEQGPVVLGLSAPQGCGKSTLTVELTNLLTQFGLKCACMSIDDFYLTHAEQEQLAEMHKGNVLLSGRGLPGTHQLSLGTTTLEQLKKLRARESTLIPRYDKSAFAGHGDRFPSKEWTRVSGPLDIVLFEGWMLGFEPVGPVTALKLGGKGMAAVDKYLDNYREAWDSHVSSWLIVQVDNPEVVHNWRLQAEQAMRASGKGAMTDAEVQQFVDRFMPAYRTYLPRLYAHGPSTSKPGTWLRIRMREDRSVYDAISG